MALGHALLHPDRVRRALDADASADAYGATMDGALGLFGFGDPGPAGAAWAEGIGARAQPFAEAIGRVARDGPFAVFFNAPAPDIPGLMAQLGGIVDAAAALDADALRLKLTAAFDTVFAAVPDLRLPDVAGLLNTEIDAALGILEAPLVGGRRDAAAHRAFRTAAEIRRRLGGLANPIPPAFAGFELKGFLRTQIVALLGKLEAPALALIGTQIGALKDEFGRLFGALGRVSVRVEVQAGGPQPMADPAPTVADEAKATPFPVGHALWWLDLITGIVAVFNLIWEMVRTSNFGPGGRYFDGIMSLLVLLWQVARVIVRAAMPGTIGEWSSGKQWLFTDQGDFVLSCAARLLASFVDAGKNTVTNWVGSVLIRGLKHVTAVSQPRFIYQFARSLWYFEAWNKLPEVSRPAPSFLRTTWAAWGPMWSIAWLVSILPSWDDFHLEGFPMSMRVWVIVGAICALAACIGMLIDRPKGTPPAADHATHGFMTGIVVLLIVLVAILVEGLESEDKGTAIALLIVVAIVTGLALLFSWLPKTSSWGSFVLIAFSGLVGAYLVPFVLGWDYIDDGRDKPGAFKGLNADTSPYRLPFTAGENWMCSQGTHGIFSHHTKDGTTNHYAFDFNEVEGSVVRAARDGVITELQEAFEDRKPDANYLHVLHTTWQQGHDPGEDDERVITFANYFHLMQGGVLPVLGQSVRRGDDIARLDSTGRSAQQHIHIATEEQQRGDPQGLPFVFGDPDTKGFRHYPLLAILPGKGAIPGKPVSYAFFRSANTAPDGPMPAAAIELALGPGGPGDHMHRVFIPAAAIAGAGDPVIVFAEPQRGHTHRISLTREAIAGLRGRREWSETGITVDDAPDGHDHAPLRRPLGTLTLNLKTAVSATAGTHRHNVTIDLTTLLPGIQATTTVTSTNDFANVGRATSPAPARHTHTVDLTRAAVQSLLERKVPAAAEVTVQRTDGHVHAFDETFPQPDATTLPSLSADLVAPPTARLAVGSAGPYRLFGGQAILRINDRVSEAWLFGAHRPELQPDLPAERGFRPTEALRFDTTDIRPATDTRGSARLGAAAMTRALRAAGGRLRHAAITPVPVIVIETRIRGSAARLRRTGGAAIFGTGAGLESRGAGDLPDIGAIPRADLAAHISAIMQAGWSAPPVAVGNAFQAGGPPLDLAPSAPRNAAVLAIAATPANGAFATPNELPLQPGPVGVTGGWSVPILAAPAVQRLDLGHAAMTGAQRDASPLVLVVSGASQPVSLAGAGADAAAVARRIMLRADGVRAWAEGAATVVVATIAGGADVSLAITKNPGLALAAVTGVSAPLAAGSTVADSGAVTPAILRDVVADAAGRDAPPYDAAIVQPTATVQGDNIRLGVAAGHTIRRAAEGLPLVAGTAAAGQQWDSDALPATLSLAGSSWTDIEVDGATMRVPITGEPARIEIGPLPRLPTNGETLELSVNNTPLTITFDALEGSITGIAEKIAAASDAIAVRFAYRLVVGGTLHGERRGPSPLRLAESRLLNLAGFLRRTALEDTAAGPVGDAMRAGPGGEIDADPPSIPWRRRGAGSTRLTVPPSDPPSLVGAAGDTLAVTPPAAGDPFGLTVGPAGTIAATVAFPVPLPGDVATWTFAASQGGAEQAIATAQAAAMPAALRATAAPEALGTGALNLAVTVIAPDGDRPPVVVDLTGFTDAEDAAARLAAIPGVIAFPVSRGAAAAAARLQIETLGRGTGWGLRLVGKDAILALGFRLPDFDPSADTLEAMGGGTVRDGAAVTAGEARAMLLRASQGAIAPEPDPPPLYAVSAPAALLLAPGIAGGPVPSLDSDPPAYAATLAATATPAGLSIPAGTSRPLSAVLHAIAGARRTTIPLIGSPAMLRSPDPLPVDGTTEATEQLAYLQANGLSISIDGTAHAVPAAPAPLATVDGAIAWIAQHILPGWVGAVADPAPGTARHLVLRSGRRGTDARAEFTVPAAGAPASGLLGFAATTTATGSGTLRDADALTILGGVGTLQRELDNRARLPDTLQTLYRAVPDDAAGTLRLVPNSTATVLGPPGGLPATFSPTVQGGTILLTTGASPQLDARLVTFTVSTAGADPGTVSAALWGAPARLPGLTPPTNLAVLAGLTLDVTVNGTARTVTLAAPASLDAVAAQIARGTAWQLRAFVRGGTLIIETVREGRDAALTLTGGTAMTDDPATGFSGPARPVAATGAGSLPDLAAATPTAIGAALQAGWLTAGSVLDDVGVRRQALDRSVYAPGIGRGNGWLLTSQRAGVPGRLEWLATQAAPGDPVWDDSLSRGAAIRAAVALPPIAATVSPSGALVIRLDDNSGPDLPSAHDVTVTFDGSALTAAGVASRIGAALRAAKAGAAGAWPDGTVVIETAHPGLAGSILVPAPGDRGVADMLVGAGATLSARGWPGGGRAGAFEPMSQGWRGVRAEAAAPLTTYEFSADGRSTGPVPIAVGMSADDAARALNTAFDGTAGGGAFRIGLAAVVDGALCAEAVVTPMTLSVDGKPSEPTTAEKPGDTPEPATDGAFDLRPTEVIRTLRLLRAPTDDPGFAGAHDFGWLRHPMQRVAAAPPTTTSASLGTASFPAFPVGRWLAAVRTDASRAANAADAAALRAATAMCPVSRPGTGPGSPAVPLMLRYWVTLSGQADGLLGGSAAGPEPFMLDILTWR